MASEICPMPPSLAASSANSAVEISTPIPPTMMGTNSFRPNFKRKSSTRFIQILCSLLWLDGLPWRVEFYPSAWLELPLRQCPRAARVLQPGVELFQVDAGLFAGKNMGFEP